MSGWEMEYSTFIQRQKKESRVDLAYKGIRELILTEQIEAGAMLRENQLADYLQMSRTPVREAIRRLEAEGLLESIAGTGTFLKRLSAKDIKDIYQIRTALEIIACDTAIYSITDEEIESEREQLNRFVEQHKRGERFDRMEFSRIDGNIHDMIIDHSDNAYIKTLMDQIYFNVDRYRIISFKLSYNLLESTKQHLDILEVLKSRELPALKERLEKHIEWSLQLLLDKLSL